MKFLKNLFLIAGIASVIIVTSCDDNTEILVDPEDEFDARLNANRTDSTTAEVFVTDVTDGEVNALVSFSGENIRRVYIVSNELGQGEEALDASDVFGVNDKGDGSVDVESSNSGGVAYNFRFPLVGLPTEDGTVVYKFWATSGKGDFRDATDNLVQGPFTLTINLGGSNPATALKEATDVQLFAPTADLMSDSFVATADGVIYPLDDFENSALWDFGYSAQGNTPQLTSAFSSPQRFIVDGNNISFQELIENETGAAAESLNKVYFADIDDSFDFDGASTSADFASLTVSNSDAQTFTIPTAADGDLVAFVDQYGKKGIIRIDVLFDGGSDGNFFNSNDYVQFDIKVQP